MLDNLWQPVTIGRLRLPNRLAMCAMTRNRARPDGVPTPLGATYYAQRASFGLTISEGTQPSEDGQGYLLTPGMYRDDQVAGWRGVSDAVHAAGGRFFVQLMHVGRIAHPANTPHHREPVAPSAVRPAGMMITAQGPQEMPIPRALSVDEIAATIDDYRHAAACAIAAGADGIELHGANGYLIHQFLSDNANLRTDEYGGSIAGRIRFAVEVAAAVAAEIGADRTGLRISPGNAFNDIVEADAPALYDALLRALAPLGLAYLHVVHKGEVEPLQRLRALWPTALLVNRPKRPRQEIAIDVDTGLAEMATVATMALANPDLVARLRAGTPLNEPDRATFYGGDERGYSDYPTLEATSVFPAVP